MKVKLLRQIWFMSRLAIFGLVLQLVFLNVLLAKDGNAQNKSLNETFVELRSRNMSLKQVFSRIERETGFSFIYSRDLVDDTFIIEKDLDGTSLVEIFIGISQQTGIGFKRINDNIYLNQDKEWLEKLRYENSLRQQKGTNVSGIITDENGEPLPGVNVVIKGTGQGTATDLEGKYTVTAPKTAILVFQSIGYKPQEIAVGNQTQINLQLEPDTQQLNEVVVTAFGLEREKKSLGYSVQEIKAEGMAEVRSENVTSSLAGKVAGLQIGESSAGMGSGIRVTIRGNSSFEGKNSPLWVIDGVPFEDTGAQSSKISSSRWNTNDGGNSMIDLNPDDIENISVLKGPNAAALYGSRAANGVILVTTKSAKKTDGLRLELNTNFQTREAFDFFERQNVYGQGLGGNFDVNGLKSWGAKMEGQMIDSWRDPGKQVQYLPHDQAEDFFETGYSITNSMVLASGNEKRSFRFSAMDSDNEGISPYHRLHKNSLSLDLNQKFGKLNLRFKTTYMRNTQRAKESLGYGGDMLTFVTMPRNMRPEDLRRSEDENGMMVFYNKKKGTNDPYYRKGGGKNSKNRIIALINANYQVNDWLSARGRVSVDRRFNDKYNYNKPATPEEFASVGWGTYTESYTKGTSVNADVLLTAKKDINDFSFSGSVGSALTYQDQHTVTAKASEMQSKGLYSLNFGVAEKPSESQTEKEIQSILAFGQVGYKNYAFLDLTARNDWSSALPNAYDKGYFYWSANASLSVSDILEDNGMEMPNWFTYAKVRASYAEVGNDTDAYRVHVYVDNYKNAQGNQLMVKDYPSQSKFDDIKPEITTSKEVGLDMRFFQNRLGLDFTWYTKSTKNQIMSIQRAASSGYSSQFINAGEIQNNGIELSLNATPVKSGDFTWDLGFNFSRNKDKIIDLYTDAFGNEVTEKSLYGGDNLKIYAIEGGGFGELYGTSFSRTPEGQTIVNANGTPIIDRNKSTASGKNFGNINPDWIGSASTQLNYKGFYLSALINIKQGGLIYSYTESFAAHHGTSTATLPHREGGLIVPNSVVKSGEGYVPNTTPITAEQYWVAVTPTSGRQAVVDEFIHDASYVQLKEVSVGYNFSKKLLKKTPLKSARLSFVATNLGFISKEAPGSPFGFSSSLTGQAIEVSGLPLTRTYGFNLNVKF
ncbi:SusC/RagA family TonB-linked outer membrane protein [Fulvitalea axinellae]|uniref:SusC/RagA family TonB-linked outer membrane protein n=1 Tax=Fulvitalea axinellae TaxID=1182444 RepID=A0AAU9CIC3_9BACT|nr:SusC/RagA family TonB-linked outer membrane protein [Fulvitalea axinellae]